MSKMSVGGLTGSGSANSRVLNHLAGSACSPLPLQRADFGANRTHFSPPRSPSVSVSGQLVNNPEARAPPEHGSPLFHSSRSRHAGKGVQAHGNHRQRLRLRAPRLADRPVLVIPAHESNHPATPAPIAASATATPIARPRRAHGGRAGGFSVSGLACWRFGSVKAAVVPRLWLGLDGFGHRPVSFVFAGPNGCLLAQRLRRWFRSA